MYSLVSGSGGRIYSPVHLSICVCNVIGLLIARGADTGLDENRMFPTHAHPKAPDIGQAKKTRAPPRFLISYTDTQRPPDKVRAILEGVSKA